MDGTTGMGSRGWLKIEPVYSRRVNFALQQNCVPVVRSLAIRNTEPRPIEDLAIALRVEPSASAPSRRSLARIDAEATHHLVDLDLAIPAGELADRTERLEAELRVEARDATGELLGSGRWPLSLLAYDEWGGARELPEMLAAFVLPNHPALPPWLREAAHRLEEATGSGALDGYQAKDPGRVLAIARALYQALAARELTYANPPASFEAEGQRIRTPDRVFGEGLATCLDLAVLYAAGLEQAGLHPVLLVVEGHAMAGVWLHEETFPETAVLDDPARVRKRVRAGHLMVVDPTAAAHSARPGWEAAVAAAERRLEEPGELFVALDVIAARRRGIRPLPSRVTGDGATVLLVEAAPGPGPGPSGPSGSGARIPTPGSPGGTVPAGTTGVPARGPEAPPAEPLPARLERWKTRLLDLSLRNRLLSLKAGASVLPVLVPGMVEGEAGPGAQGNPSRRIGLARIEDRLASSTGLWVRPRPEVLEGEDPRDQEKLRERAGADPIEALVADGLGRDRLHLDLSPEDVDRRLVELFRAERTAREEGGVATLHLALGTLVWYESPAAAEPRRAPLLLLPVELERATARDPFRLVRRDDEPVVNRTLLEKLEREHGIRVEGLDPLPEDDAGVDVAAVLARFEAQILDLPRWEVRPEAWLAQLSFTKFLMWRDLQHRAGELLECPLVRHLVETPEAAFPDPGGWPAEGELDTRVLPQRFPCPMDADSSQLAAIVSASEGKTFVLEGPPGTGKSQTITNLIAGALGAGKSVLFVSEKMAALEVVHRRLVAIGLGPFCLELHSQKAQKRAVLDQLRAALETAERSPAETWERRTAELTELRTELNEVVAALHAERPCGYSVHALAGIASGLRDAPGVPPDPDSDRCLDRGRVEARTALLAELAEAAVEVPDPAGHAFRAVRRARWEPGLARRVEAAAARLGPAAERLAQAAGNLDGLLEGTGWPWSLAAIRALVALVRSLLASPRPSGELVREPDLAGIEHRVGELLRSGRELSALRGVLGSTYRLAELAELDLARLEVAFATAADRFLLVRWWLLRGPRAELRTVFKDPARPEPEAVEALRELRSARDLVRRSAEVAGLVSGLGPLLSGWLDGIHTDWEGLEERFEWLLGFRRHLDALGDLVEDGDRLRAALSDLAGPRLDELAEGRPLGKAARALLAASEEFEPGLAAAVGDLDLDPELAFGPEDEPGFAARVRGRLERWGAEASALRAWVGCREAAGRLEADGLGPLVEAWEEGRLARHELVPSYRRHAAEHLLEGIVAGDERLRTFRGDRHGKRIERFRALDREVVELAGREVRSRLASRVPRLADSGSRDSELGILSRELQKQRRHLALRSLFQKIPELLRKLAPCMLMSPLSVAQYLDPAFPGFDLVVFDEASQIPVWDAIGAMARGRQVVVVGDSRQLPPTSFFSKADLEDGASEDDVEDLESVLDECKASRVPTLDLRWHYRSRHESLIAFSNATYYRGRLVTFPSPDAGDRSRGVRWIDVPGGVYDRSGSRTNRAEAEALVAELVRRLREDRSGRSSYGVVTFGLPQATLMEDLLDEARRRHPEIEARFDPDLPEPVFVKNLENVQGDERDVMLFSVGYGPDAQGYVSMNFGPLNRQGGERRLNVAVTRAREELLVFSTLRPEQIDLSRTRAVGVDHLKRFLDYAARGTRAIDEAVSLPPDRDFDSPFEEAVFAALRERGHGLDIQVGASVFRIDMAVRDPGAPGRYLLGIECDGATYHSAATARDRDRLRAEVLGRLGWRLHRIWSTDWWQDPEREVRRVEEAIEAARQALVTPVPESEPGTATEVGLPVGPGAKGPGADPAASGDPDRPRYTAWFPERAPCKVEDLYSRGSDRALAEALAALVAVEGPVLLDRAARMLVRSAGLGKLTAKALRRVEGLVPRAGVQAVEDDGETVLWPVGRDPAAFSGFRGPGGEGAARGLEEVPLVEVAEALAVALAREVSLPRESLAREGARLLGIGLRGVRGRERMERGISRLETAGRLVAEGERVRLPRPGEGR